MNKKRKNDNFDYFEAFGKQAHYANEMVLNLSSSLREGDVGTRELMRSLHTVENDADAVNHSIQAHLLGDFVVPMERGGMANLAHALDDVCDAVEQVAIDSYVRKVDGSEVVRMEGFTDLTGCLERGTESLCSAVGMLREFGGCRHKIRDCCIEAQTFESDADKVYIESVRSLYEDASLSDVERRVRHDLLSALEDAMDAIENAAERLESLVAESV